MDEILIEEKKYISSKQASKITGYAKDYVGQLCREGRVPARLVGRSWYVLESAIQDHRFGDQEIQAKSTVKITPPPESIAPPSEFPRYESSRMEILPSLSNRLQNLESVPTEEKNKEMSQETSQNLHDSWKEWFDHVGTNSLVIEPTSSSTDLVIEPEEEESFSTPIETDKKLEIEAEDEVTPVPLHVISQPLPRRELLPEKQVQAPERFNDAYGREEMVPLKRKKGSRTVIRAVKTIFVLCGVMAVVLVIISSGYFDDYLISSTQVTTISGITVYNK